jgi:hypothetical protein
MIVIPAGLALGAALLLALVAIANMGREAQNLAHVAEDDYQRRGTNWGVFLLALLVALVLLGAVGAGPLAGLVAVEGMR